MCSRGYDKPHSYERARVHTHTHQHIYMYTHTHTHTRARARARAYIYDSYIVHSRYIVSRILECVTHLRIASSRALACILCAETSSSSSSSLSLSHTDTYASIHAGCVSPASADCGLVRNWASATREHGYAPIITGSDSSPWNRPPFALSETWVALKGL